MARTTKFDFRGEEEGWGSDCDLDSPEGIGTTEDLLVGLRDAVAGSRTTKEGARCRTGACTS